MSKLKQLANSEIANIVISALACIAGFALAAALQH